MTLLITDLDNTLYDWVTFHATALGALVDTLARLLDTEKEGLLDEFKAVNQAYGDSEQIRAVLDLPVVRRRFRSVTNFEVITALYPAFNAYETERLRHLQLYPSVLPTLELLRFNGIKIVGHTEARASTAYDRLDRLGILSFFDRLYALEGVQEGYSDAIYGREHNPPDNFVQVVPLSERKPNPGLVLDICKRELCLPEEAWYVGDSIVRDMSMAKAAGVAAVWAKYGTRYDAELWKVLVRVTHWTEEDVRQEAELRESLGSVTPDYIIESFRELLTLLLPAQSATVPSLRREMVLRSHLLG